MSMEHCPFCGRPATLTVDARCSNTHIFTTFVKCNHCGAQGPKHRARDGSLTVRSEMARELWEKRWQPSKGMDRKER